jgi:hypothetical protein
MKRWTPLISIYLIGISGLIISGVFCLNAWGSEPGSATVTSDTLAVYSRRSTESSVVKTLKKGEVVIIEFEIERTEGAWCRITEEGQTESMGNVQCEYLEPREPAIRWVAPEKPILVPPVPAPAEPVAELSELVEKATELFKEGKTEEAARIAEEVLDAVKEKIPEHPGVSSSLNNLAELLSSRGEYARAEDLNKMALEISES